ncbi:hypothetical protein [Photobacterium galatheae]|nr:hypothetical protein [Photobacterium galatheae]
MHRPFQLTDELVGFYGLEERHTGMWALENTDASCVLFDSEGDAQLAYNYMTLMPVVNVFNGR